MNDIRPRKKMEGIRKQALGPRPEFSVGKEAAPERMVAQPRIKKDTSSRIVQDMPDVKIPKQKSAPEPSNKESLIERFTPQEPSKDSHVIRDRYFRKEVLPPGIFRRKGFLGFLSGLAVLGIGFALISTVFARATITVKPLAESVQVDTMRVVFDASTADILAGSRTLPAEFLLFNESVREDFNASGSGYVNQKASGRVKIYNNFSTAPQSLVANTRFMSDSGILFRLTKSITVPGAKKDIIGGLIPQFIEADIIADKAGEGSNITTEARLSIPGFKGTPKFEGFYAVAPSGFSGGASGQGRFVTAADISAAQQTVTKKVFDQLKQNIPQKIPQHFVYQESLGAIEITEIAAPKEKTMANIFTVEVKAAAHVIIFRDADMTNLMNQLLLNGDQTKMLINGSNDFHYQIKNADYNKRTAEGIVNGTIKSKKILIPQDIAMLAVGKKKNELIDALKARSEISTFRVSFFPPWIIAAPRNTGQINVIVEDPGAGKTK